MPRIQVKKIGESAVLPLSEDMMEFLGICFGDEVDVIIENQRLIIYPMNEDEKKRKVGKAVCEVFERRDSAYRRLAEGVQEDQP